MSNVEILANTIECATPNRILTAYLNRADLTNNPLFRESIQTFLLFDYQYITEPYLFLPLLKREDALGIYVGHLDVLFPRNEVESAIYIPKTSTEVEVSDAFNYQVSTQDGPIQVFVERGFAIPTNAQWCVWFSSYWEIAIAGFLSLELAFDFVRRQGQIPFKNNRDATEHYAMNPTSSAPSLLKYYLERNALSDDPASMELP